MHMPNLLGIKFDSLEQVLRLPGPKLARLQSLIQEWSRNKSASKHDFQVLLGHLNHATAVVRLGRSFLWEIISTMSRPRQSNHPVRLNVACRADIAWWAMFLESWNGVSLIPSPSASITVVADASGSWGCGAVCHQSGEWFQLEWPGSWQGRGIAAKELVPLVLSAAIWGRGWSGQTIRFLSDNSAVVAALLSRLARDPVLSHLLCCLFFIEAHFKFVHVAEHVPGRLNRAADALSRDRLSVFLSVFPQVRSQPSAIPLPVRELLLDASLSWISPHWTELFRDILSRV